MRTEILQILALVLLTGCSRNEMSDNKIIGNWVTFDSWDLYNNEEIHNRFIFFSNGKFVDADDLYHIDSPGDWEIDGNRIKINYDYGTANQYYIQTITDTTLVVIEDKGTTFEQILKFKKNPFKKDTLRTGTFYSDSGVNDLPTLVFINADSKDTLHQLSRNKDGFILINTNKLTNYKLEVTVNPNYAMKRTAVYGQFELFWDQIPDKITELEFNVQIDFKGDSIFVLKRNWQESHQRKYIDSIFLFTGTIKYKMAIE